MLFKRTKFKSAVLTTLILVLTLQMTIPTKNVKADHIKEWFTYSKPKKKYLGHHYSSWITIYSAKHKLKSHFTKIITATNSTNGSVGLTHHQLSATMGFNVSHSESVSVDVPFSFNGKYRQKVQYRKRYDYYKVTRVRTEHVDWVTHKKTLTAHVSKYSGIFSRVVRDR